MPRVNYPTDPLDPVKDVQFYVERVEDEKVGSLVQRGKYVALIGARRTGKTSLLHRLLVQLEQGCIPLYVDVMPFEDKGEKWYRHVAERMLDQFQKRIEVKASERTELLDLASDDIGFSRFLEALAKKTKPTDRILVMMDEVGTIPSEISDPLFRSLRSDYNSRKFSEFYRYTFIFAGVFEPADFIKRSKRGSIFDVAKKVYMTDADINGVHQLVALLDPDVNDKIVGYIHDWTGGHLYLTQCLCSILDDQGVVNITEDSIDRAVDDIIAHDDSIVHIREMLNSDKSARSTLLQKVLAGKRLKWGNTVARKLNLIGVVREGDKHNCVIRNRIFEKALREYFQEEFPAELDNARTDPKLKRPLEDNISQLYILHLSDLHFGTTEDAKLWFDQLAQDVSNELKCPYISVLILSGDIANESTEAEYAAAKHFLDSLCQEFQLQKEQIIIVPGNHDLNWPLADKAYKLFDRNEYKGEFKEGSYIVVSGSVIRVRDEKKYKQRFAHFSNFYQTIKGETYPPEYEQQGILYHFPEHNLLILGLNSAWQLDRHYRSRASIHSNTLSNALTEIRRHSEYENCLKFAVWHHPLNSPFDDRITDQSFMQRLAQAGFRIALHGHIHKADTSLYSYDQSVGGRKLNVIGAGTFGAHTREWMPGYPLQYNLLKLEEKKLTVETRCRREINGAWQPDAIWTQGPGKDPLPRYTIDL